MSRPRRTRIYGANYDIGENSYKKLLQDIDNKRGIGRSPLDTPITLGRETSLPPRVSFMQDEDEFDRQNYRASLRAKLDMGDDDADAFGSTLRKSRLRNKFLDEEDGDILGSAFKSSKFGRGLDESAMESSSSLKSSMKYRASAEPFESAFKSMNLNGADESVFGSEGLKSRILKGRSILDDVDNQDSNAFSSRRIKIRSENIISGDSSATTEASSRMKATKARLADLESEMSSIHDKQSERETRKRNLRKLLHESESDAFQSLEI